MNKTFWTILKDFPPASVNSARDIIKSYLEKFIKYHNDYFAKQLEQLGVDVDYHFMDNGN
jgi:hypothetical protein